MPDIRNTIENTYNKLSIGDKAVAKSLNTNIQPLDIKDTINNWGFVQFQNRILIL